MTTPAPTVTDHDHFERQLLELRKREKAHTRQGDAIGAARRRLSMTQVPPDTTVKGWPQFPTHSFMRTDERGAPMGPRNGGRPVPQWMGPGFGSDRVRRGADRSP